MDQFRIAADSSCNLLALDGADFVSVPLTIRTDAEEFRDDASLDVDAMVAALRATKGRSYSACPNIAQWEEAFGERGDVIAFTITSGLSGSYNAACAAKEICRQRDPSRRIHVVDSLSAGPEIALLIEKALSETRAGADFDGVCRAVQEYRERTRLLFALESMHNLAQNGRVNRLVATMAGVLGIRAVGQASAEGTLEMLGKARGARRAADAAADAVRNGAARLQGRQRPNRALPERDARAGNPRRDPPALPGGGRADPSAAGAVQLLRRARRNHAGV